MITIYCMAIMFFLYLYPALYFIYVMDKKEWELRNKSQKYSAKFKQKLHQ